MVIKYKNEEKEFNFILENLPKTDNNYYTVLVGKNGTGKSRLLNSIILKLMEDDVLITQLSHIDSTKFMN